jgi:hypothetical protein
MSEAENRMICSCSVCRDGCYTSQELADHYVYDVEGELDYIEIAHVECAKKDNARRAAASLRTYWEFEA